MSSSNKCQHHCRFQCLLLFPAIISYKPAFSAKDVLISLAGAIFAHGNVPSRFDCVTIIAGASLIKIKKKPKLSMASCIGLCLSLFPFHSFSFSSDIRMRYILHTMYTSVWLRAFWRQVHTQDDHRKLRSSAYSRPRRALDDVRKDRCACSQISCCGSDGAECTWVDLQEQQSREQHVYKHAGDSTVTWSCSSVHVMGPWLASPTQGY